MFRIIPFIFFYIINIANATTLNEAEMCQKLYMQASLPSATSVDVDKAITNYETLLKTDNNLKYEIRIASLIAMKARCVFMPNKKMEYANKSIKYFTNLENKIYQANDKNLIYEFHLYRGTTFIHFPSIFNKKQIATMDIEKAIQILPTINVDSKEKGQLFLTYAKILQKQGKNENAKIFAKKALLEDLSENNIVEAKRF